MSRISILPLYFQSILPKLPEISHFLNWLSLENFGISPGIPTTFSLLPDIFHWYPSKEGLQIFASKAHSQNSFFNSNEMSSITIMSFYRCKTPTKDYFILINCHEWGFPFSCIKTYEGILWSYGFVAEWLRHWDKDPKVLSSIPREAFSGESC